MGFPCPQLPSQTVSGTALIWGRDTFNTLPLCQLTIRENDRTVAKHCRERGLRVPEWLKSCIDPAPFFPDVVLRVCNVTVGCVGPLSMFLQCTVGEFICPTPDPGRSSMGMASHESELALAPRLWFHWWQGIDPVVHSPVYKLCNKPACLQFSFL